MKLLTKEIKNKLSALYSQEGKGLDAMVIVKFFNPQGAGTWYATEACAMIKDGDEWVEKLLKDIKPEDEVIDIRFFGLIDLFEKELGYFSFNEIKEFKGGYGLGIERDLYFESKPLKDFM